MCYWTTIALNVRCLTLLLYILSPWGKQCGDIWFLTTPGLLPLPHNALCCWNHVCGHWQDPLKSYPALFLFIAKIMAICTTSLKQKCVLPIGFSLSEPLHKKVWESLNKCCSVMFFVYEKRLGSHCSPLSNLLNKILKADFSHLSTSDFSVPSCSCNEEVKLLSMIPCCWCQKFLYHGLYVNIVALKETRMCL